ncbi:MULTISPECIES: ABC transporter permease [Microbacterium]|uniref:ABC transporter permease n=1 Tax=Microbacterium aquilitoris TaxID=3067307 RepID=A0ABU3GJX4_9MICO|nr:MULTISPECIES: ABC transporter permease [unclassified Microbacterium]MDT3331002.1 ABC transporter permease [Microbacterium sp. KSW-18]MDT3344224.1 ABC transporter permease [Microbacterium sp. KSW2-22]SDG25573.1 oligopeptide transport system permease protein [Microbacterium sp. 77mftsu3.1]
MSSNSAHYVAPTNTESVPVDQLRLSEKKSNLWIDAWRDLRRRPTFWISVVLCAIIVAMAVAPTLFTSVAPSGGVCTLDNSNGDPTAGHPLGFDRQGCDIWSRVVHGTRTSMIVGVMATLISTVIGVIMGALAGFYGGFLDTVLSRVGDVFFTIPYIIAAVVVMSVLADYRNEFVLALAIGGFSWASTARIARAEVLRVKQSDYVTASISIGLSRFRTMVTHVLPNAMAPVIVVTTLSLGTAIVAESTLSFLGVGLGGSTVSWGLDISQAQNQIRSAPMALFWPSLALTISVLAFITLGELLRDAVDPKSRAQR